MQQLQHFQHFIIYVKTVSFEGRKLTKNAQNFIQTKNESNNNYLFQNVNVNVNNTTDLEIHKKTCDIIVNFEKRSPTELKSFKFGKGQEDLGLTTDGKKVCSSSNLYWIFLLKCF